MSAEQATFCCLQCRLIQPTTFDCRECGSATVAALQYEGEVLRMRQTPRRSKAANVAIQTGITVGVFGGYIATVIGGLLVTPIVPVVVFTGGIGLGAFILGRRRKQVTTVQLLEPQTGERAVTRKGIVRRLTDTVTSIDADERVLAEDAILRGKRDGVLFRRVRAVPFLVELDGGDRLVVEGTLRVTGRSKRLGPAAKPGDARLVALGIDGVPASGELEVAVVREGDPVEVTGEAEVEAVQALAVDRDGGETTVMRGRAKSVALVRHR